MPIPPAANYMSSPLPMEYSMLLYTIYQYITCRCHSHRNGTGPCLHHRTVCRWHRSTLTRTLSRTRPPRSWPPPPASCRRSHTPPPPPSSCPRCGPALRHRDRTWRLWINMKKVGTSANVDTRHTTADTCNCRHHHSTEPPTCTSSCSGCSRCRCRHLPPLWSCSYWHQLILQYIFCTNSKWIEDYYTLQMQSIH